MRSRETTHRFLAAAHAAVRARGALDLRGGYRRHLRELKASGANIVEPLAKMPWGLRQFTVQDLDGNVFYFHHD